MRSHKFACADFTFPLLPHDKVLDLIVLLDCQGVDIGLFSSRSHLRPENEFKNLKQNARTLKSKLNDRELIASDVYLQLFNNPFVYAINHPDKKQRDYARENFLKLIEYAGELGADHISCLPGMHFPHEERSDSIERSYQELRWRVEQVQHTNLSFGVEAHIGSLFTSPEHAELLIKSVSGLTLTLDYTHFIYNGYEQTDIDPLTIYASHFHARGARKNRLQTSMVENIINYETIVQTLRDVKYEGWIGLEYIWTDWERCNDVDNISETIRIRDIIKGALNK